LQQDRVSWHGTRGKKLAWKIGSKGRRWNQGGNKWRILRGSRAFKKVSSSKGNGANCTNKMERKRGKGGDHAV